MKTVILLFALVLAFYSCVKEDWSDTNRAIDVITVAEDFNWRTDQIINLTVMTDKAIVVKVSSEDKSIVYHKGFYSQSEQFEVTVTVPAYEKALYVNSELLQIDGEELFCDLRTEMGFKSMKADLSGQKLWWSFDEEDGFSCTDEIAGLKAKIYNGSFVPGETNEGIALSGERSYIDISDAKDELEKALSTSSSISFWGRIDGVGEPNSAYMVHLRDHGADSELRIEYSSSDQVRFIYQDWEARVLLTKDMSGVEVEDGIWHQFVMSWDVDSKVLQAFIDGELVGEFSDLPVWNPELSSALLGKRSDDVHGGQNLTGSIDEFILWDHPLNLSEVDQLFENSDFSLNHFGFNEGEGSISSDQAGDYNAIIHGATWENGILGKALRFNGESDWVEIEDSEGLDLRGAITMMAWIKVEDNGTFKIFQKGDWDGMGIGMSKWSGFQGHIRGVDDETHKAEWDGGTPMLNTWYHVALTYDGQVLKLYVNGEEAATNSVGVPLRPNSRIISIGSDNGGQKFFPGVIDEAAIFAKALSADAIKAYYVELPNSDADGDGVNDSQDEFPENANLAFENTFPAGGSGSLAFEDLWPGKGDFDFNDLVIDYRFEILTNSQNFVSKINAEFELRAIGASYKNGFGFQLSGQSLDPNDFSCKGSTLTEDYIFLNDQGLEADTKKPTIIVFDNAYGILRSSGGSGVNTDPENSYVDPVSILIEIIVKPDTYTISDIQIEEFNPFIIVNGNRGHEIHLPNYQPTDKADLSLFGTSNDNSAPTADRYYKTQNNLPWALNISGHFDYPVEKTKISSAYLHFTSWATSAGRNYSDWFLDKVGYRDLNAVY